MSKMNVIEMKNIVKDFTLGYDGFLSVLKNISFNVLHGEFLAIVGQSGSGKSTLMNLMGALDTPTSGQYLLEGTDIADLDDSRLSSIRNQKIGFVFQSFNLIPRSSAIRNVELPMLYAGYDASARRKRAFELLHMVGMADRAGHFPAQLSGGERQRVAIARAMANNPEIILADEPTGSLDSATGDIVMDIFCKLNKQEGKTIIFITHNETLAKLADRVITIHDGEII